MDWDDEYDLQVAGGGMGVGPPIPAPIFGAVPQPHAQPQLQPQPQQRGQPQRNQNQDQDQDIPETQTPLEQLTRHWMNERHAPDILPSQEALLASVLDHIRRQSETVQLLRQDPNSSEEEHMRIMLAQTEVERVKFIVRSYMCTRLYKIEKFARYITTNVDVQTRLSAVEQAHAVRHADLTDKHFHLSVLQSLPDTQRALDDAPLYMPPMMTEPDKNRPVFVHALKTCPPIRLPDGTALEMEKGHISLTPFAVVEQLVARGEVELV